MSQPSEEHGAPPHVSRAQLKRGELVQPERLHYFRVLGAEPLVVLPSPPRRATSIHEWMFRNQQPPLHFFTNQDFLNLWSCVHLFLTSSRNNLRSPFCAKTPGSQNLSGIDFPSAYRKSFTCDSRRNVDLRLQYEVLKVRELHLNML